MKGITSKSVIFFTLLMLIGFTAKTQASLPGGVRVLEDVNGNKVAVWNSGVASMAVVRAATKGSLDVAWSTPVTISNPLRHSEGPQLSMNTAGDVVVVWLEDGASLRELVSAELPAAGTWSAAVTVSAADHNVSFERYGVEINDSGSIVAYYRAYDTTAGWFGIFAAEALIGGGWNAPLQVSESLP